MALPKDCTEGPWIYRPVTAPEESDCVDVVNPRGKPVACLLANDAETRANARLIAAADKLYEALATDTLNQLLGLIEDGDLAELWSFARMWMEQRDAALAKARGKG